MTPGALLTLVGVAGLLVAEWRGAQRGRAWLKLLASAGFLLAALRAPTGGSLPEGWSWALLAGLGASAAGDTLLGMRGSRAFIGGMGAFALAHLAYGAWFAQAATWLTLLPAAAALLTAGHLAWRWLEPHVTGRLKLPVRGYVALVSLMAASAIARAATGLVTGAADAEVLAAAAGGVLFFVSDLAVARQRFVAPGFVNRAWGLPVYYAAQLLIAYAVAA